MLPLLLASGLAHGADPCAGDASALDQRYQVVLLVDRSGSMKQVPEGIKAARARTEALLDKLAGYGDQAVAVTLATFGTGLVATWPTKGPGGSPRDAKLALDQFFPSDPAAYGEQRTCLYKSIYQLAAPRLGVSDTGQDLRAAAAWDFLVFTDGQDNCPDTAAEKAWLDRNREALRHVIWPVQKGGVGELSQGGPEYLYAWTAPLQGVVNLSAGRRDSIEVSSPPAITFFPRLLGNPELAACPAIAEASAPEVPFHLLSPRGEATDEPGWRVEGAAPASMQPFQARWAPGSVTLPAELPEGRYLLAPSPSHVCAALSTVGPGVAFSPLSTGPSCAAASFDVTRAASVVLSGQSGALDAPIPELVPGLLGAFLPVDRPLAVAAPGGKGTASVTLAVETAGGVAVPGDVELCAGGQCGGQLTVLAGDEPVPIDLRVHPRAQPWTLSTWLGADPGVATGELGLRVCASSPGLAVSCADCSGQADARGCVSIPGRVSWRPHLGAWLSGLAGLAVLTAWFTRPKFHPALKVGNDRAALLHTNWARFSRRPLYIVRHGEELRLRGSKVGAVAELRPGAGSPAACAFVLLPLTRGWRLGAGRLEPMPKPQQFNRPGDGLEFSEIDPGTRTIRIERSAK